MTDPKTPQEWNEAVAKTLGLDCATDQWGRVLVFGSGLEGPLVPFDERKEYGVEFDPATDPDTARWVVEWLGKSVYLDYVPAVKLWSCVVGRGEDYRGTFCEVICWVIVGEAGDDD